MKKGKLITCGGNLHLSPSDPILTELVRSAKAGSSDEPKIGIIPSANANPRTILKIYSHLFKIMGAEPVEVDPKDKEEADREDILAKIDSVDAFFITGGHQLRISAQILGSEMLKSIYDRFLEGVPIAGTGAGAVCLTERMIPQDLIRHDFLKGEIELTEGLGIVEGMIIQTHFTIRGRLPGLIHVISENPEFLGLGLGESTAAVWDLNSGVFKVVGDKNIMVIDGGCVDEDEIGSIGIGEPIKVSGLKLHMLSESDSFDIDDREVSYHIKTDD